MDACPVTCLLIKDGLDKSCPVEGPQVIHLFPDADEFDGQLQLVGDADHNASLGGTVELCQDNMGDAELIIWVTPSSL